LAPARLVENDDVDAVVGGTAGFVSLLANTDVGFSSTTGSGFLGGR